MDKVAPIVAICIVGLCVCVGSLAFMAFNALRKRFGKDSHSFELDDNVLEVDLRRYRNEKKQQK